MTRPPIDGHLSTTSTFPCPRGVRWREIRFHITYKFVRIKVGFYLKAVFPSRNLALMRISRSRFKQSKNCSFISRIYVLRSFGNFWVIFGKHQRNKRRCQELCWKVHDRAQCFVLRSYTTHKLRNDPFLIACSSNSSKQRTKTYNKNFIQFHN